MARHTQKAIAKKTGLSQQRISQFLRQRVILHGEDPDVSSRKIIHHLGEVAAGRRGNDEALDLCAERAKLARAQTAKIGFDLARARGEFISLPAVARAHSEVNAIIRSHLLSLANKIGSIAPRLDLKVVSAIDTVVREALEQLAATRLPSEVMAEIKRIDDEAFQRAATETKVDTDEPVRRRRSKVSKNEPAGDRKRNKAAK